MEGFTHLIPFAAGHEVIRQERKRLTLYRMTPDLIYDQMIGMGAAEQAGLLVGRQSGRRHACTACATRSRTAGRAARAGRALARGHGQRLRRGRGRICRSRCCAATSAPDLPRVNAGIRTVTCPFTGEELAAVPAIRPDVSVIHAQKADRRRQRAARGHRRRAEGSGARGQALAGHGRGDRRATSLALAQCCASCRRWTVTAIASCPRGAHPSYAHGYYKRDNGFYIALGQDLARPRHFLAWMGATCSGRRRRSPPSRLGQTGRLTATTPATR